MARAIAHTNIALVKYWGKRDAALNLPATGSLSLTLDGFYTDTTVTLGGETDRLTLDGTAASDAETARVSRYLDLVRDLAGRTERAQIESENHVPTAAGLASSASGFCALALAASSAYGLDLDPRALSVLARRGSGSAARSVFGGFVRMDKGVRDDGEDCAASPIATPAGFDLCLLVVRCATGRKKVGSTVGMNSTEQTSPYFPAWVETHDADMRAAEAAIAARDLDALGATMEHSTLKMHASALAAQPGLWYFRPVTLAVMDAVRALREEGVTAYFTMDAGPHVKVLCRAEDGEGIADRLSQIEGTRGVSVCRPGPAARLVDG